MHYYQRHIGDYSKDTGHLSLLEHGVYAVLLDWQYATEQPLPEDMQAIYRLCRASSAAEKRATEFVVTNFFPACTAFDGKRFNKRTHAEILAFAHKSDKNRMAAEVRWQNYRNAFASQTNSDANASHKPLSINQEPSGGGSVALPEISSDIGEEIVAWGMAWPGEMQTGTPKMSEKFVRDFADRMTGRRELPGNWKVHMITRWRNQFRFPGEAARPGFSPEKYGAKKTGEVSASVKAIQNGQRRKEIAERMGELDEQIESLWKACAPIDKDFENEKLQLQKELAAMGGDQ